MRSRAPGLGLVTDKGIDATAVGTAVGVPARGVAEGQHGEGVEAHGGVDAVVVTPEAMDNFRALHLFSRLTEEAQCSGHAAPLHGVLSGEDSGECSDAERRVWVGVTRCELGE